jgi:hypothetical protein
MLAQATPDKCDIAISKMLNSLSTLLNHLKAMQFGMFGAELGALKVTIQNATQNCL